MKNGTGKITTTREPHTIIVARGDHVRHFVVRPWLAATAMATAVIVTVGHFAAAGYLLLRDDLNSANHARQTRIQQAYEDRISALRGQVDRILSRQLLDQQVMEQKLATLMERQHELTERHGRLSPVVDRVSGNGSAGIGQPHLVPVPQKRPDPNAQIDAHLELEKRPVIDEFTTASIGSASSIVTQRTSPLLAYAPELDGLRIGPNKANEIFAQIDGALGEMEQKQVQNVAMMTHDAHQTTKDIMSVLKDVGIDMKLNTSAQGGPLEETDLLSQTGFETQVSELDNAVSQLRQVKRTISKLPVANPIPNRAITSRFGYRRDPILGRRAMHSGLDFKASVGEAILASGDGVVTLAGWNGGYGRMVEIKHSNGLTTRYAHLSKILVFKGQRVQARQTIGKAGSSGRSTGPHLHFEVRKNNKPQNPLRFLRAGKRLAQHL